MNSQQILGKAKTERIWTFFRNGVPEDVKLERWAWGVVYKNGSELHQFDAQGIFHQVKEIAWEDVALFCIFKPEGADTERIDIVVQPEMQMFYYYTNTNAWYNGLNNFSHIYTYGWKDKGEGGRVVYNFILPDDRIVQSNCENIDLTKFKLTI